MKKTKQGVRDLNDLPSKPKGRVLPDPPVAVLCKHRFREEYLTGYVVCRDCGESWDPYAR